MNNEKENKLRESAEQLAKHYCMVGSTMYDKLVERLICFAKSESSKSYHAPDNVDFEELRKEALQCFINEIKNEFKDQNWDYLEFISQRVISNYPPSVQNSGSDALLKSYDELLEIAKHYIKNHDYIVIANAEKNKTEFLKSKTT